jgi:hypothetical protein
MRRRGERRHALPLRRETDAVSDVMVAGALRLQEPIPHHRPRLCRAISPESALAHAGRLVARPGPAGDNARPPCGFPGSCVSSSVQPLPARARSGKHRRALLRQPSRVLLRQHGRALTCRRSRALLRRHGRA